MLEKDAILSKISIIKKCLNTIKKVTNLDSSQLDDIIVQDVFVLNLQRSVQACIDISNIIIAEKGLGLPATYKESFSLLDKNGILNRDLCDKMSKMVGFRNIAVHDYQELDVNILKNILEKHLDDIKEFISVIYNFINNN